MIKHSVKKKHNKNIEEMPLIGHPRSWVIPQRT